MGKLSIRDDVDLATAVSAAQAGDEAATIRLYDHCHQYVRAIAARYRKRAMAADVSMEDLTQEAILHLLESVREFDTGRDIDFIPYLRSRLRWRLANYLRSEERRRGHLADGIDIGQIERAAASPRSGPSYGHRLTRLIRRLSPRQRMVIARIYWQERSTAEVARELGVTDKAITALRRRAERAIRRELLSSVEARDVSSAGGRPIEPEE